MRPGWTLTASASVIVDVLGIDRAVDEGLFGAASALEGDWKNHLRQPGNGLRYEDELRTLTASDGRRFVAPVGRRVPHTASAPGEAPAPDRGALLGSIGVEDLPEKHALRVGTDKAYARYLRDGVTDHPGGIVIEPRAVEPSIETVEPRMTAAMRRALLPVGVRVS